MAVKITSIAKAVDEQGLKCLVYGRAGAGKTVLSCTTGEPTLLISAEAGLLSVKQAPKYIKVAKVESLSDLDELYDFLLDDVNENGPDDRMFTWVALDSITEIAEQILSYEKENANDPRKAYGELQDRMLKLMKKFRDLPHYDVLMTSKMQIGENENQRKTYQPMMPGTKLSQQIPYLFDEVFCLRVEKDDDGDDYRILQTCPDVSYDGKDRSGKLDDFEEPNLKKIKAKIHAEPKKKGASIKEKLKAADIIEDDEEELESEETQQEVEEAADVQVEPDVVEEAEEETEEE